MDLVLGTCLMCWWHIRDCPLLKTLLPLSFRSVIILLLWVMILYISESIPIPTWKLDLKVSRAICLSPLQMRGLDSIMWQAVTTPRRVPNRPEGWVLAKLFSLSCCETPLREQLRQQPATVGRNVKHKAAIIAPSVCSTPVFMLPTCVS